MAWPALSQSSHRRHRSVIAPPPNRSLLSPSAADVGRAPGVRIVAINRGQAIMKIRSHIIALLATTAIFAPAAAFAQDAAAGAEADAGEGEIVVYGRGETRQVQELDSAALTILAAGTSPLKAIEKLPSVNFQSADPFGNYEWSTRVTIRGFSQNQLGFTLDGIPLGDMTYGNNNGLHISRAIAPENIGITRV
jgi:iron complex outermembrane recepter protein